jgi:hypothetical protein
VLQPTSAAAAVRELTGSSGSGSGAGAPPASGNNSLRARGPATHNPYAFGLLSALLVWSSVPAAQRVALVCVCRYVLSFAHQTAPRSRQRYAEFLEGEDHGFDSFEQKQQQQGAGGEDEAWRRSLPPLHGSVGVGWGHGQYLSTSARGQTRRSGGTLSAAPPQAAAAAAAAGVGASTSPRSRPASRLASRPSSPSMQVRSSFCFASLLAHEC